MTTVTQGKFQVYLPEGIDKVPETVLEALVAGKAVLEEEARWITGTWFLNPHPEVDYEDAFCNDWKVCAEGAVAVCTVGLYPSNEVFERDAVGNTIFDPVTGKSKRRPAYVWDSAMAATHRNDVWNLYREACRVLARAGSEHFGQMWYTHANEYNDKVCRTRTSALAWFDVAIRMATEDEEAVKA